MEDLPRGLVTFLVTDIEASTRLHQSLGELYPEVLREHDLLLAGVFEAAGGRLVTHLSDGTGQGPIRAQRERGAP